MTKAIFYHAGCPVCVSAETDLLSLIPSNEVAIVHLGSEPQKIKEAAHAGVQSVPALVLANGNVLHINFGASIEDLK
ncbi:thioredoxin domain-containing protein [Paenimyroides baculatum]|uniref:Thioredoxin family protein n=1 Tax=Paenimyroides baculatum TaxID=2608000 RepID=A0A5M6CK38_9FLAO|nr:thioredoxin family protein [Paenimyroides baculatum]KAA5535591.1 thioredoxin family protein [Paenimyroides baculatum]